VKLAGALAACGLLAGCAGLAAEPSAPPRLDGYLPASQIDGLAVLTPPPFSLIGADDLAMMRTVEPGTDRWWLAIAHAELRPPEAAQHFDCVLGTRLAEKPRPALTRLMGRLLSDAETLTQAMARERPEGARKRPIAVIDGLEPCQRLAPGTRRSPAWPVGGAVVAGAYGRLFAALAPDRAEEARRIGREIGWSRVVCRMNWASDVEAGLGVGEGLYARAPDRPGFGADLEAARAEVAAARAEGLTNPGCAAERRALRQWRAPEPVIVPMPAAA
jgi:acid phosphatase (class A)